MNNNIHTGLVQATCDICTDSFCPTGNKYGFLHAPVLLPQQCIFGAQYALHVAINRIGCLDHFCLIRRRAYCDLGWG